jgi:glycosyl transferase family 25
MRTTKKHRKRRSLKRARYEGGSNNLQIKYPPKEINNYIKHVIYINLDKRTDRNESMLKQLEVFDKDKINRISAVNNPENPVLACATSHLNAIKMARERNFSNVLILEDDAIWENVKKGYDSFKKLIEEPYDVIMLGGTYKSYNIKTFRINSAQSAASYLINSSYYDKIITKIENTLNDPAVDKFVDVIYTHMQKQDKWLLVVPALMIQAPSQSNIEKREVNYKNLFYNRRFNPENIPNNNSSQTGENISIY